MATGLHRVLLAAGAAAGIYGVGLGIAAPAEKPSSDEEAQQNASLGHLGLETARDVGIAFADDALFPVIAAGVKKFAPQYKGIANLVMQGAGVIGAGVAGGIFGHDFMNYLEARRRAAAIGDIDYSNYKMPDNRINPIDGFVSGTPVAQQRGQMTGINSPAFQALGHLATHNPFADLINSSLTGRQQTDDSQDPKTKALAFSWLGSILGSAIGARGGIARATLMGVVGGIAGGSYGIFSAHNQNLDKNLDALKEVAVGALPMFLAAGTIFGAHKIPKIGQFIDKGLDLSTKAFGQSGLALKKGQIALQKAAYPAGIQARNITNAAAMGIGNSEIWGGIDTNLGPLAKSKFGINMRTEELANAALSKFTSSDIAQKVTTGAINFSGKFAGDFISPVLRESGKAKGRWEQSIAVGHVLTFVPHQALVGATAINLVQGNRKSKATNTMPSNRKQ